MKTDEIASGIIGIKSKAVIKFIMVLLILVSLLFGFLLGVFFNEPILDYVGIGLHKEFKEKVMDENKVDE